MLSLTEEQIRAMSLEKAPLKLINPHTREVFVLIRHDVYDLTCNIVGGKEGQVWDDQDDDLIRKKS